MSILKLIMFLASLYVIFFFVVQEGLQDSELNTKNKAYQIIRIDLSLTNNALSNGGHRILI